MECYMNHIGQLLQSENRLDIEINDLNSVKELLEKEKQLAREKTDLENLRKWLQQFCAELGDAALVQHMQQLLGREITLENEYNNIDDIHKELLDGQRCLEHFKTLLAEEEEVKQAVDELRNLKTRLEDLVDNKDNVQSLNQLLDREKELGQDIHHLQNVKNVLIENKNAYLNTQCQEGAILLEYLQEILRQEKVLKLELECLKNLKESVSKCDHHSNNEEIGNLENKETKESESTCIQIPKNDKISNSGTYGEEKDGSLFVPSCSHRCILKSNESILNNKSVRQQERDDDSNKERKSLESIKQRFEDETDFKRLQSLLETCIQNSTLSPEDTTYLEALKQRLEDGVNLEQELSNLLEVKTRLETRLQTGLEQSVTTQNNKNLPETTQETKQGNIREKCLSKEEEQLLNKQKDLEKEISDLSNIKIIFQKCRETPSVVHNCASYAKLLERLLQIGGRYSKEIEFLSRVEHTFKQSMDREAMSSKDTRYLARLRELLNRERELHSEVQELIEVQQVFQEHWKHCTCKQKSVSTCKQISARTASPEKAGGILQSKDEAVGTELWHNTQEVQIDQEIQTIQCTKEYKPQNSFAKNESISRDQHKCLKCQERPQLKSFNLINQYKTQRHENSLVKIETIKQNIENIKDKTLLTKNEDLCSRNNALGELHEFLTEKLEEIKLEKEHTEQMLEGPMRRELDRLKRRSVDLERQLNTRKQIVDGAVKGFECEMLKQNLELTQKNISDLRFVNDGLRSEVLLLNQKCVRMEEVLINEKVNSVLRDR